MLQPVLHETGKVYVCVEGRIHENMRTRYVYSRILPCVDRSLVWSQSAPNPVPERDDVIFRVTVVQSFPPKISL